MNCASIFYFYPIIIPIYAYMFFSFYTHRLQMMDKSPENSVKITTTQVEKIAHLARLAIHQADLNKYAQELTAIVQFVEQMQTVDTQDIEPLAHALDLVQEAETCRLDKVTESNVREKMQAIAPAVAAGLYLVPKVIETTDNEKE